ncbi:DsbA family protein [Dietzia lutea]|uniref:Protein-disulfide isomerase n=1 Tax=Dietzia lutea TaxID=546160 RepID=A0A2S1R5U9_9ACTN|nr:thioredoxin domain-containing protein [Dietzia lutea]AWH91653.1 protein-disulfide isomerase [Dietzia lutea]
MNAKPNKSTKVLQTKSNNGMIITVVALIAVAVVVLGGVVWMAQRGGEANPITFGETADEQIEITDTGVVIVGQQDAPTIQVWEDYMCPACGSFEAQYGESISEAVEAGDLRVEFHTLNFLNGQSGSGEYSTRALAAVQCVAAKDSLPVFFDVKNAFFAEQPAEGGGDRSAQELAGTAEEAGANPDTVECIGNVETNGGMDKASDSADNAQQTIREITDRVSTPTVAFEGEVVDLANAAWLQEIVA